MEFTGKAGEEGWAGGRTGEKVQYPGAKGLAEGSEECPVRRECKLESGIRSG